jgi:hypothetical protein
MKALAMANLTGAMAGTVEIVNFWFELQVAQVLFPSPPFSLLFLSFLLLTVSST